MMDLISSKFYPLTFILLLILALIFGLSYFQFQGLTTPAPDDPIHFEFQSQIPKLTSYKPEVVSNSDIHRSFL